VEGFCVTPTKPPRNSIAVSPACPGHRQRNGTCETPLGNRFVDTCAPGLSSRGLRRVKFPVCRFFR
jgi:hypothetical protein